MHVERGKVYEYVCVCVGVGGQNVYMWRTDVDEKL
jgi:hypothetical protein